MQVKVTLSVEGRESLARRAALERRSLAAMGGLLIEVGLNGGGVGPFVEESGAPPPSSSERTAMCEHRVPAGSFCKQGCDG